MLIWGAPLVTKAAPALHGPVRLATALLMIAFFVTLVGGVPESVLRGMNLGYRRMGLQASLNIVAGVLMVGAIRWGLGLAGLGGAQVGVAVVTGIVFWYLARRYVPWFGLAWPTRQDIRSLLAMSAWLTVGEAVVKLLLACDVLILGIVVAPAVVTSYSLTSYAARTAVGIHVFAASAAMPGLGGLIGRGDHRRVTELRHELQTLTWLFGTAVGATILAWNPSFLSHWVGAQHYAGPWVDSLIVLGALQTVLIRTDAYIIDAALQPRPRVLAAAGAAAATIALTVPLTRAFGMVGLCVGLLLGRSVQSIAYPLLVRGCLAEGWRPYSGGVRLAAVTLLLFAIASVMGTALHAAGWIAWAAGVALTLTVAIGVALVLGLPAATRRRLINRVRHLVLRSKGDR